MSPSGPLPSSDPATGSERLPLIDALRGFALAGVLLVNVGSFTLYVFLDPATRAALPTAAFDAVARWLHSALIDRKAITLFSLLFGLGFAMQLQRAEAGGADGLRLFARRLAVLFGIGLVHAVFIWWGDVLLMYTVLGLALILFRHASERVLLTAGLLAALILPSLASPWMDALVAQLPTFDNMKALSLRAFGSADYPAVVRQNIVFGTWTYAAWWDDWFFIFGRFLLGYWAGRQGLFYDPAAHRERLTRICVGAAVVGVIGTAVELGQSAIAEAVPVLSSAIGVFALRIIARAGPLGLGITYTTGFALLFLLPAWRRPLEALAPVGRMALTNYLVQSIAGVATFYAVGFRLGPDLGYASRLAFAAAVFGAEIVFSHWWLARFRFGPVEWLWRSLTYGRLAPIRGGVLSAGAPAGER